MLDRIGPSIIVVHSAGGPFSWLVMNERPQLVKGVVNVEGAGATPFMQGAVYGLRRGFDPRFKHLRPGLVLQKMMLEDGLRRGDRCYDLGTGSHDTKLAWRTSVQTSYRFTFFPRLVLRAQLLRWNRWLRRQLHGERDVACSS